MNKKSIINYSSSYLCDAALRVVHPRVLPVLLVHVDADDRADDGLARQDRTGLLGLPSVLHPGMRQEFDYMQNRMLFGWEINPQMKCHMTNGRER